MAKESGSKKETQQKHPFETNPPTHERYVVGDDNWGLSETALPINHENVNNGKGSDQVSEVARNSEEMRPMYDDLQSSYMHKSHTNGKG